GGPGVDCRPAAPRLHTRTAPGRCSTKATWSALEYAASLPAVTVTPGKEVVEFSVIATSKGGALEALARASAADAWLYLGDDVTDESVFARLGDDDMGVKVGGGDTSATHRITGTDDARHLLEKLVRARRELG